MYSETYPPSCKIKLIWRPPWKSFYEIVMPGKKILCCRFSGYCSFCYDRLLVSDHWVMKWTVILNFIFMFLLASLTTHDSEQHMQGSKYNERFWQTSNIFLLLINNIRRLCTKLTTFLVEDGLVEHSHKWNNITNREILIYIEYL